MVLVSFSTDPEHSVHGNPSTPFSIMLLTGPTYPVANRLAKKWISCRIRLVGKTSIMKSLPVSKWCGYFYFILWLFVVTDVWVDLLVCCKVMVSMIKVTPLYILVSGRKKAITPELLVALSLSSKELCVFCFVEVIQFFRLVVLVVFGAVD